jgi:hypothetical protein
MILTFLLAEILRGLGNMAPRETGLHALMIPSAFLTIVTAAFSRENN